MSRPRCPKPLTLAVMFGVLTAAGCGDERKGDEPNTGAVTGEVRYNGDKVPMGTVTFVADAGGKQTTVAIEDGIYKVTNLAPGKYHLGVSSVPPPPNGPDGFKAAAHPDPHPSPATPQVAVSTVPRIDLSPATSPLTVDVARGKQKYNIKLPVAK